jgi:hypothetical protein
MVTLEEARQKLEGHGGYTWLLNGGSFWTVKQVVDAFAREGRQISISTVTSWFRSLPHTQGSAKKQGLVASKNDLITLFASQMIH